MPPGLAAVVSRARFVLLDFDGPICSVFAGLQAPVVAAQLRAVLAGAATPAHVAPGDEDDPMELMRAAGRLGPPTSIRVESEFRRAELEAVGSAEPTEGARDVILAAEATGRPVAVVSNNSYDAVQVYLAAQQLAVLVDVVAARDGADSTNLKPSPFLLNVAVSKLGAEPRDCVMVGDTVSDIECAKAGAARSIGYANKRGKREVLTLAGADAVVDDMRDIAAALRNSPLG